MKKLLFSFLIAVVVIVLAGSVASALPTNRGIDNAKEASPAIDDSGELKAPPEFVAQLPENELTKIIFIRYASAREPAECGNNICEPREKKSCPSDCQQRGDDEEPISCYGFLAGAKPHWNWVEDYYYNDSDLGTISSFATSVWDSATSATIFGSGFSGAGTWGDYDYKNSIVYGNYDDTGMCPTSDPCVIGVTAVWFQGKNIYEYDILFDTDYFPGSASVDLDTVVLHEFGHAAGLNDLYNTSCVSEVMYGYYDGVDLDLGPGDTFGIQKMYGI